MICFVPRGVYQGVRAWEGVCALAAPNFLLFPGRRPGANGVSSLPTLRSQVQMHTRATNGRNSTPTNARPPCTLAVACPCCTATARPRARSSAAAAARRKRRRVGDWEWTLDSGAEPCPSVASLPGCLAKEKRASEGSRTRSHASILSGVATNECRRERGATYAGTGTAALAARGSIGCASSTQAADALAAAWTILSSPTEPAVVHCYASLRELDPGRGRLDQELGEMLAHADLLEGPPGSSCPVSGDGTVTDHDLHSP